MNVEKIIIIWRREKIVAYCSHRALTNALWRNGVKRRHGVSVAHRSALPAAISPRINSTYLNNNSRRGNAAYQ